MEFRFAVYLASVTLVKQVDLRSALKSSIQKFQNSILKKISEACSPKFFREEEVVISKI